MGGLLDRVLIGGLYAMLFVARTVRTKHRTCRTAPAALARFASDFGLPPPLLISHGRHQKVNYDPSPLESSTVLYLQVIYVPSEAVQFQAGMMDFRLPQGFAVLGLFRLLSLALEA